MSSTVRSVVANLRLVEALGATYHTGSVSELGLAPNIVVECTGAAPLIRTVAETVAPGAIICLTGVGPPVIPDARVRPRR